MRKELADDGRKRLAPRREREGYDEEARSDSERRPDQDDATHNYNDILGERVGKRDNGRLELVELTLLEGLRLDWRPKKRACSVPAFEEDVSLSLSRTLADPLLTFRTTW